MTDKRALGFRDQNQRLAADHRGNFSGGSGNRGFQRHGDSVRAAQSQTTRLTFYARLVNDAVIRVNENEREPGNEYVGI